MTESGIVDMTSSTSGAGYFWNGVSIQGGNLDAKNPSACKSSKLIFP